MKNKNGFTLIELIVCFALVATVTISLFKTVLAIQEKQAKNISYNSYLSFVSVLNNTIEKDFLNDAINSISSCGTNCYDITYQNKGIIRLEVNKTNNTITYDSNTEKLPTNYKFYKDISLTNHAAVSTSNLNSYYLLRLPIKSNFFPNMADVKYMHQYNNENSNAEKYILNLNLDGGTLSGEYNNLLYSTDTVVTLPVPTKENYVFKNWIKVNENNGTISGNDFTMGTNNASLKAVYKISMLNFSYTENIQTFSIPESGYYKLKVWGADGGNKGTIVGGKGGYTEAIFYLELNQKLYITIGGKGISNCTTDSCAGGYNGGGMSSNTYHGSGGGATHIATASGLLSTLSGNTSSVLIVAGGGGGASNINGGKCTGGASGGIAGLDGFYRSDAPSYSGKGGNQTAGGAATNCPVAGSFGQGGGRSTNSAGGGGGYYGGSCGWGSSGGGGSSYTSNTRINDSAIFISGNGTIPTHNGMEGNNNGYASIEYIPSISKTIYNYKTTGIQEKFVAPSTGTYKLEVWGADGGNKGTILGGKGGYSMGTINLVEGDSLYISVGGKGISDCTTDSCAGGYNGGGMSSNTYHGSGGGATHIATASGVLSTLGGNTSSILIVAGGGGGASNINGGKCTGGASGGIAGLDGFYRSDAPSYSGKGGNQTAGGAATNCPVAGSFGQGGGRSTNSAGGGGGYYGGSCGWGSSGGGGSSYIDGVNSSSAYDITATTISGNETIPTHDGMVESNNDGYARITYLGE